MIGVREEQPRDRSAIREVNIRAFGQPEEADIVDRLRQNCTELLSLVAIRQDRVVGHILFSPVRIEGENRAVHGMGLAPMAVLPEYQGQGIGSELVRTGIASLESRRCPFVVVLGDAQYYPRFGFEPASLRGIRCEWDVPDQAFMTLVLSEAEMHGLAGVARYRQEFAGTV